MVDTVRLASLCMVAFAGGWAFFLTGFPAPWLAGAMLVAAAASLAGLRTTVPDWLRHLTFIALGLQVGASFTWQNIAHIATWPLSLAMLAATVLALMAGVSWFYCRIFKWDPSTAFFASAPGALSMVMALAEDRNSDVRRIAVVQCMRLFCLVALFPLLVMTTGSVGIAPIPGGASSSAAHLLLICSFGAVCGYAAHRARVPAGFLIGAMCGNAALHLSGLAEGSVPQWILVPAFVLLGTLVGVRFQGISLSQLTRLLGSGLAGFAVAVAISGAGAVAASIMTGIPLLVVLLAYAPGGLEVMTILAFALGLNPAFVATHQVARYLALSLALPALSAFVHKRRQT